MKKELLGDFTLNTPKRSGLDNLIPSTPRPNLSHDVSITSSNRTPDEYMPVSFNMVLPKYAHRALKQYSLDHGTTMAKVSLGAVTSFLDLQS